MRIIYLLLSPTFGMHQYTADLANRMAAAGHDVHLVTTAHAPRAPYSQRVQIHTPSAARNTGFSPAGANLAAVRRVVQTLAAFSPPFLVHITGVHLWNPLLLRWLRGRGVPTIHTLHDLDPHLGVRFGRLIRLWNQAVIASAGHLLVHGQLYRQRLIQQGAPAGRVTYTPLLHLFLSDAGFANLAPLHVQSEPLALFFGRLERYKGVAELVAAGGQLSSSSSHCGQIVLAGPGSLSHLGVASLPPNIELRNRLIDDQEGIDLFRRCGLVVLPYLDATQSALIASAYYFHKPVIVTNAGALAEYVVAGETGWIVPPGDVPALAERLSSALSDMEHLRRMGAAGRAWYDRQRPAEWAAVQAMYQTAMADARFAP